MKLFLVIAAFGAMASGAPSDNAVDQLLQKANNQFTAKMFTEVTKLNPGKSVVMSAFSVLTPLAQLSLASEGKSHDELLTAIGLPSDESIKEVFPRINSQLRNVNNDKVTLKQAARIYVSDKTKLNSKFQEESAKIFGSDVRSVDFGKNEAAAADINGWVEDNTNKKIKDLVKADSLGDDTRAVLVNAIYFKGAWKHPFNVNNTEDRDFHVSKTETKKVPTMYLKENLLYAESSELNAKLLRLPYGKEGDSSMLIVLPNEIDGLNALEEKLKDPEALPKAIQQLSTFEVEVFLPKFKIETETDLKEVLQKMNVKEIFGRDAHLSKLFEGNEQVAIDKAVQKAFIEVSEEGTEAAAANAYNAQILSLPSVLEPKLIFKADRSFYLGIYVKDIDTFTATYHSK